MKEFTSMSDWGGSTSKNRNAILVTIDCLRADHLSCYGYERKTTPFMDYLAAKGIKFENAFANGPFTVASFPSILASAYPLEICNQIPLSPDVVLISEVLQRKGIKTAAVHSNPYLSTFYGYNRGWNYFQDFCHSIPHNKNLKRSSFRSAAKQCLPKKILEFYYFFKIFLGFTHIPYVDAETITRYSIAWLSKNKNRPFFLWIHYMDIHEPYWTLNVKFERKYSKKVSRLTQTKIWNDMSKGKLNFKSIRKVIDIYDDKLSYIDKCVEKLFNILDSEGLIESTLIILTADHGQEFLDHGCFGHTARFYDEILHVPLILFGPRAKRQINRNLVSLLDVAPTILSFYGITVPVDYRGHNLLSKFTNPFIISEAAHNEKFKEFSSNFKTYAVRTLHWKFIRHESYCELYNLEKDPKETENVLDDEQEKFKEFQSIVNKHILWEEKIRTRRSTIIEKERLRRKIKKLKSLSKI